MQAKEERMNELKRDIDSLKSENATMNALIVALRNKIKELECEITGVEQVHTKADITITTLQKDNKELQSHVLELESRIRTHMHEREEAERKTAAINNKLTELASKVSTITGAKITNDVAGIELLIKKVTEIVDDNTMYRGKMLTNREKIDHLESENKANRETINRLVSEMNKIEKDQADSKLKSQNLRVELDNARDTKKALEKEIDTLKDRLSTMQTAWTATKNELENKHSTFTGQTANIKQLENEILYAKSCLNAFKEQVASLLSDGFVKVSPNEDEIKEKVKMLMTSSKDRGLLLASMESKTQQLASQLTEQINLYKELEGKYHRSESHAIEMENRLKKLDNEYCANEVLRDNLKSDRVKYLSFLERMGCILKVSQISADVGLDMNVDLILARAEQLVKMETESLTDKQTNIYNLQRKVKSMKEQLDNKELHLDLLRKKVASLEEERSSKCALEREVDDHVAMSKKFKVKVEKLTEQLNSLKSENSELKAKLLDISSVKNHSLSQESEIHKLMDKIKELEAIKEKQSMKLAKYRDEFDSVNSEISKSRCSSDSAVQTLCQEIRHLKIDLERAQNREKQLMDFRSVVARMLGLDANNLAIADYEIIARIERIIATFNGVVLPVQIQPSVRIPSPSSQHHHHHQQQQQQHHHHHHQSSSATSSSSASPTRTSNHHHHHSNHRERSPSPSRRSKSPRKVTIDPNSY